ncbi:SPX domain-containing protein 1-like [Cryptomeria japonica]|uniref:SPX domain-containing protein 1-like n=1 Tax=Cryptomeria japonica TaxID=3369 RepID=UPI0025AB69CA|nr:SPX domain-containing protein 1-like [Cryptomeria japonica]
MKFGKWFELLLHHILPEWRDRFISYTFLKKRIKLIEAVRNDIIVADSNQDFLNRYEVDFINLLSVELDKINKFMEEKSRECNVRLQTLKERIEKVKSGYTQAMVMSSHERDEVVLLGKDLVNLHGELVLLENYNVWNFTGLRKILKKYHRRIGAFKGEQSIPWAKCQPFSSNVFILKILNECKRILQCFLYVSFMGSNEDHDTLRRAMFQNENEQSVYKSSVEALESLNEMTKFNFVYVGN